MRNKSKEWKEQGLTIVAGEAGMLNGEFAYFGLGDPISWDTIEFGPVCDLHGEQSGESVWTGAGEGR